jgi:outer membrane protein assembly factor BamB
MKTSSPRWVCLLASFVAASAVSGQTNWPRWRGPQDNGCAEGGTYPVEWSEKDIRWKAPLPGYGCSTPIAWNGRIYLTAPAEGKDAVLAIDWSGKRLWQTTFGREKAGKHRNGSGCNASPATDGLGVFVYFKSGTFAALEFDGKVRWQTNLVAAFGPDTLYWDHGTSPVLTEKFAIMARMHHGESWLAAFDKTTGEMRWKAARNYETPVEGDHSYATPLVLRRDGRERLLVWGGEHVSLHETTDGKSLWSVGDFNPELRLNWPTVATPVVVGDIAVVPYGRADRGLPRLHGIGLADGHRLWKRDDAGTFVPSPVAFNGMVYIVRDRGEVECIEPATGKTVWSDAFPKASANFYASPIIAGGKLYSVREDGTVFVAAVDGKFELLAENKLREKVIASPAAVSSRLLFRGEQHLICTGAR